MGFFSDNKNIPNQHRQQFVDIKVVLYRLNLRSSFRIGNRSDISFNVIFNTDFADPLYSDISTRLNKGSIRPFLDEYYKRTLEELVGRDPLLSLDLLDDNVAFHEIDITPLVRSLGIHLDLMPINRCQIRMLDPQLNDLQNIELSRYGPRKQGFVAVDQVRKKPDLLNELRDLRINEFDLIRVFVSSPVERDSEAEPTVLRKDDISRVVEDKLVDRFSMLPVFTGLVNSISRTNAVGQSASMDVTCLGMQRMFMQSVTMNNEALANQLRETNTETKALSDKFSVYDNRFSGHDTDTIIKDIFKDYFHPKFLSERNSKELLVGVPDIKGLFDAGLPPTTPGVVSEPVLIPMFPSILLFHMLKKKYGEPIVRIDDRIDGSMARARRIPGYPYSNNVNFQGNKSVMINILRPYLIRFRHAFSFYSASYQSAEDVFNDIRNATFLEFFEDRTGEFHLRFPRYNNASIRTIIDAKDVISVSFTRDDSAIYTADESQIKLPVIASSTIVPPQVFTDKFSVFKFGFRRPQKIENPNAYRSSTANNFAQLLAEFNRDYYTLKTSRTATVNKIGDPTVNVGDMVFFKLQRETKREKKETPGIDFEQEFAGYVLSIDEQIEIGGTYTQRLNLGFVRAVEVSEPVQINAAHPSTGTIWDAMSSGALKINGGRRLSRGLLGKNPSDNFDTTPFLHEILAGSREINVNMREVLDPIDLAFAAAEADEMASMAGENDLHNRKKKKPDPRELAAGKASNREKINELKLRLASAAIHLAILKGLRSGSPAQSPININIFPQNLSQARESPININIFPQNLSQARESVVRAKTKTDLFVIANTMRDRLQAERAKFTSTKGISNARKVLEPRTFSLGREVVQLTDVLNGNPPPLNTRMMGSILGWGVFFGSVDRKRIEAGDLSFKRVWRDLFSVRSDEPLLDADRRIAIQTIRNIDVAVDILQSDIEAVLNDTTRLDALVQEAEKFDKAIAAAEKDKADAAAKNKETKENERSSALPKGT
jgi:hypothetical protein